MAPDSGIQIASWAKGLLCHSCGERFESTQRRLICLCGQPLEQQYERDPGLEVGSWADLNSGEGAGIWKYHRMLPVRQLQNVVTLHEGNTPLVPLPREGARLGVRLLVKEEGRNPTGSFKARGASVGVSRLKELGWLKLGMPTTGSGGSAWSAYAARAGVRLQVGIPTIDGISEIAFSEPAAYGARMQRYSGPTTRAFGSFAASLDPDTAYVGGLYEPYRLEGEKTVFYEVVEQLGGEVPDFIVWPTGGAVGLVGIAKAYEELVGLKLAAARDRFTIVSAQHSTCAPIANALRNNAPDIESAEPGGIAPGVWVGDPFGSRYILSRVRSCARVDGATADDEGIRTTLRRVALEEGLLLSPEGALGLAGLAQLVEAGKVPSSATVVCVNTGSGLRYPHLLRVNSADGRGDSVGAEL